MKLYMARWWRRVRCWLLFEWHDPNAAGYCRRCDTYIGSVGDTTLDNYGR